MIEDDVNGDTPSASAEHAGSGVSAPFILRPVATSLLALAAVSGGPGVLQPARR